MSAKFENAEEMQVTITTTLPLRIWAIIADRTRIGLKDSYNSHVSDYHTQICGVIDKVRQEFVEESE